MNNTKIATFRLSAIAAIAVVMMGAPDLPGGARVVPGEQRRWALDFRVRLEQPGELRPIEIDIRGDWVSTISAVRPGETDVALQLANARIQGDLGTSVPADASNQLQQRLSRLFWATYREDGALLAVHFFKDVSPSDRNLLQMIATEIQFVHAGAERSTWSVGERDGGGEYQAIYNRTAPSEVVKRKLKYVSIDGAPGVPANGVRVDVDRSELRLSLDPDGGIVTLDGSNRVRIGLPFGKTGQLTATTETHLSGLRSSRAPELVGSLARALPGLVSSPVVTHESDPEQLRAGMDQRLLEGHSTESLLAAAMAKGDDRMLPDRLVALFRRRPEATAEATALLRKNGPEKRITDALGSAESQAAIHALGSMARDRDLPRSLRIDAITAFIRMQNPSVEAMRVPFDLMDDDDVRIASAARIVSGALARAGRATHPGEADRMDAALIARYRKVEGDAEVPDLLAAMGNSTGSPVVPVIEEALRDPRVPIRVAAARALRLSPGPEVDRLLAAAITEDRDPAVRAAALFAVSFRHPVGARLGEALVRAAKADTAEHVRSSAITLLRQNPEASPRIAETLQWIAEHDSKPGVRRLAQEALTSKR